MRTNILKKTLGFIFSVIIACLTGLVIGLATFIIIICIYANFFVPDIVGGATVAYDIARCFHLETSQLDCLVENKILTGPELELLNSDTSLRRDVVWHTVLPAYGIYPYPASIYHLPFPTTADPAYQPYVDARAAAIVCGLASVDDDPTSGMPQEEYDALITQLETGTVSLPPYPSDCPYLENQAWTAETYRGRNSLLIGWERIPDSWRTDFVAQGWEINFTLPTFIDSETGTTSRHETAGVTHYQEKTISLDTSDPTTAVHEFAHYAAYRAGWLYDADFKADYAAEAPALTAILGNYSQTNPREYFAEFVSYWLLHPTYQSRLQALAPKTSVWVTKIISDFPLLVPSAEAP